MDIRDALGHIAERRDLSTEEMTGVMRHIMSGGADNAQIGASLRGMRLKGETIEEITGAVMVTPMWFFELSKTRLLESLD